MRKPALLLPLALFAAPATAAQPSQSQEFQVPRELSDPAVAARLGDMVQALSRVFLDLKIGEVQAAAEGRKPTAAEKSLTVREMGRRDDPNFDRNYEQQIAQSKPMIEQSMKAMAQSLPALMQSMSGAAKQMERVVENMPRPDYPRR